MTTRASDLERALQEAEELLRQRDQIHAQAQRGLESARQAQYPERRRRDRRVAATDRPGLPERRAGNRRQ